MQNEDSSSHVLIFSVACVCASCVSRTGVGAIIGKAGAAIKSLQADTGARVQVSNETLPQSSEKTVSMGAHTNRAHLTAGRNGNGNSRSPLCCACPFR